MCLLAHGRGMVRVIYSFIFNLIGKFGKCVQLIMISFNFPFYKIRKYVQLYIIYQFLFSSFLLFEIKVWEFFVILNEGIVWVGKVVGLGKVRVGGWRQVGGFRQVMGGVEAGIVRVRMGGWWVRVGVIQVGWIQVGGGQVDRWGGYQVSRASGAWQEGKGGARQVMVG